MQPPAGEGGDFAIARTSAEVVVRVGLLLLLAFWCFSIAEPFLVPIVWGMVIAVAVHRGYAKLRHALGDRDGLAATLVSIVLLLVLIVPLAMLSRALVDDVAGIAGALDRGGVAIPPPPGWLAGWPVVGAPLDQFWRQATANLGAGPGPRSSRSCRRWGFGCSRSSPAPASACSASWPPSSSPASCSPTARPAERLAEAVAAPADGSPRRRSRPPGRAHDPRRRPRRPGHGPDPVDPGRASASSRRASRAPPS